MKQIPQFGQDATMKTGYSSTTEEAMRRLFDSLNERDRRLYAGAEALKLERGGLLYLTHLFDCDPKTIRRGIRELQQQTCLSPGQSRKKGADGKPARACFPTLTPPSWMSCAPTPQAIQCKKALCGPIFRCVGWQPN
jgi:hypothetical protein